MLNIFKKKEKPKEEIMEVVEQPEEPIKHQTEQKEESLEECTCCITTRKEAANLMKGLEVINNNLLSGLQEIDALRSRIEQLAIEAQNEEQPIEKESIIQEAKKDVRKKFN